MGNSGVERRVASADGEPGNRPRPRAWVTWRPGTDTAWALVSLLGMWAGYVGTSRTDSPWPLYAAVLLFGTLLPAWQIFLHRREGWAGLGVTRHRLLLSLAVAAFVGIGSLAQALTLARATGVDPWAHLAANVAVLWEPLFFFGWLHLRFERACGILPAPLLTAMAFVVMHVGAVPLEQAVAFGVFGLFAAVLMAATRNLAVLWPLAYPVASAIGTLQAGLAFGWAEAAAGTALMVVQVAVIAGLARAASRRADVTDADPSRNRPA